MPIVQVIRETDILSVFPNKTEGDLYLWVLDHQRYLVEQGATLQPLEDAAHNFKDAIKQKKRRKPPADKEPRKKTR